MRRLPIKALLAAALLVFSPLSATDAYAQSVPVDMELVLAVDTSFSVDTREFNLQIEGIAAAFEHPEVLAVLQSAAPNGIAVSLMQWAGEGSATFAVDWHYVREARTAAAFAAAVRGAGRVTPPGPTGIGAAITAAAQAILNNGFAGTRRTIDVSGDGINNNGMIVDTARDSVVAAGVTVNGLTILNEAPYLEFYYQNHVIGGQGSFTISTPDYDGFATAIRLKLIQEIRGPGLVQVEPGVRFAQR